MNRIEYQNGHYVAINADGEFVAAVDTRSADQHSNANAMHRACGVVAAAYGWKAAPAHRVPSWFVREPATHHVAAQETDDF